MLYENMSIDQKYWHNDQNYFDHKCHYGRVNVYVIIMLLIVMLLVSETYQLHDKT